MNRRIALTAAVAGAAALAGVGWAAWRRSIAPADPAAAPTPAAPTATRPALTAGEIATALWSMQFDRPDGGSLAMTALRGRSTLLNFWATWCPPCVEEIPMLDAFHREHGASGWQVVGLAIDSPTQVRQFLAKQPVTFPIGLAGLAGMDLVRDLGNPGGALPFTVILDAAGGVVDRKLGALKGEDLAGWHRRFTAQR
jgi:thiol-disulfide isomerase/thioredoxin